MFRPGAGLSPTVLLLIVSTILTLAAGQVLFKNAAAGISLSRPSSFMSWALTAALLLYAIATLMWLLVLARVRLSVAFPFYGLTFLIVPVLAWLLLKEPLRIQTLLGGMVILVGVIISTSGD